MKALFYSVNPVLWATCKWLRHFWPGCLVSGLNGLKLRDVPPPELPGEDWVLVRTRMAGLCGTDLAVVAQRQAPNSILQAFSSLPAVLGHENVAEVQSVGAAVDPAWVGRRVCVEPTLCCAVRGIDPPCPQCAAGQFNACRHFGGDCDGSAGLPAGTNVGYNARTGGSFGECFVAHVSQLVPVPDELSDEQAVLTDPLACSLHAVLRADLGQADRVLVYGAGVLGLGVIAALRALGWEGHIDALDRHDYVTDLAGGLGANELFRLPPARAARFAEIARRTGASTHRVRFGNYTLSGGYDIVFDCAGTGASFTESLKWTRSRGQVVLVATSGAGKVDLTPVWFTELTVLGVYGRQEEDYQGRRVGTYTLVHEMLRDGRLKPDGLLTHTFALDEYRQALTVGLRKGAHRAVKVAFDFRQDPATAKPADPTGQTEEQP